MNFDLPADLIAYLAKLDAFIESDITPLQQADDNERFFDHRREWARTDWDAGGVPKAEWEALLSEAQRRADRAGFLRFSCHGVRRLWRIESMDVRDPRASGSQRSGTAQRSTERAFDRWKFSRGDHAAGLR